MHNNDVDEQTCEVSYPRELKIIHFKAGGRVVQSEYVRPWASVVKLFVCQQLRFVK